jgi:hypothetical protein
MRHLLQASEDRRKKEVKGHLCPELPDIQDSIAYCKVAELGFPFLVGATYKHG